MLAIDANSKIACRRGAEPGRRTDFECHNVAKAISSLKRVLAIRQVKI
jgi:hypothetical protein